MAPFPIGSFGKLNRTAHVTGNVHEIGEKFEPLVIRKLSRFDFHINARIRAVQPVPAQHDFYPRIFLESEGIRRFRVQIKAIRVFHCDRPIARNRVGGHETDFDPVRPGGENFRGIQTQHRSEYLVGDNLDLPDQGLSWRGLSAEPGDRRIDQYGVQPAQVQIDTLKYVTVKRAFGVDAEELPVTHAGGAETGGCGRDLPVPHQVVQWFVVSRIHHNLQRVFAGAFRIFRISCAGDNRDIDHEGVDP